MRTTKVLSVTLPDEMLKQAKRRAKLENRTMSELVREALRRYEWSLAFDEIRAYAKEHEPVPRMSEQEVVDMIHEFRREQRAKTSRRAEPVKSRKAS